MKKKSKRLTIRQKNKISKRVKEHHRKQRKEARRNPDKRKPLSKDPGIPNTFPHKELLLRQMEAHKKQVEDHKRKQRELRQRQLDAKRFGITTDQAALVDMVAAAQADAQHFHQQQAAALAATDAMRGQRTRELGAAQQSRRAFFKQLRHVVEASDVVLEVLDARDPEGCRARAVERAILGRDARKKIVLVLNKVDLVPKDVVVEWLQVLRREFPTVAFKASTQEQSRHLARAGAKATAAVPEVLSGSKCVGAEQLLQLLKNYSRRHEMKTAITVGVVGYPNVGKSSLINSLKRSRAAGVSSTPGFTKSLQEVLVDRTIKLIDCPGIIFDQGAAADSTASLFLRNCVSVEQMQDPESTVAALLAKTTPEVMMQLYRIPRFSGPDQFLTSLAHKLNRFKKGGIPDKDKVARTVLQDWNAGKLPFYTKPPRATASAPAASAKVVQQWSEEFDLERVLAGEKAAVLDALGDDDGREYVSMESSGAGERDLEVAAALEGGGLDEEDESDEEEEESKWVVGGGAAAAAAESGMDEEDEEEEEEDEDASAGRSSGARRAAPLLSRKERALNPQVNQERRKAQKRAKKEERRAARMEMEEDEEGEESEDGSGSESEEEDGVAAAAGGASDAYDFATDFYQ